MSEKFDPYYGTVNAEAYRELKKAASVKKPIKTMSIAHAELVHSDGENGNKWAKNLYKKRKKYMNKGWTGKTIDDVKNSVEKKKKTKTSGGYKVVDTKEEFENVKKASEINAKIANGREAMKREADKAKVRKESEIAGDWRKMRAGLTRTRRKRGDH